MDLLQRQDECLLGEQLISFGRAMNYRSFSTTPPSPLFRAAAGFSFQCIHASHSGHISEGGSADGIFLLPRDPILPCCNLNEGHNHFVWPPKQNIYGNFAPFSCTLFTHFHTRSESQHYFRFTETEDPCLASRNFRWLVAPTPTPTTIPGTEFM